MRGILKAILLLTEQQSMEVEHNGFQCTCAFTTLLQQLIIKLQSTFYQFDTNIWSPEPLLHVKKKSLSLVSNPKGWNVELNFNKSGNKFWTYCVATRSFTRFICGNPTGEQHVLVMFRFRDYSHQLVFIVNVILFSWPMFPI